MSKLTEEIQEENEAPEDLGLDEGDYCFVIGADGELKHLFTPQDFALDPPKTVQRILKIFGIKDINQIGTDGDETLH